MAQVSRHPGDEAGGQAIRRTMSPAEAGAYLTWLGDGADPDAKAFLRHEIPAPVLFIFTRLFGRSYRRGYRRPDCPGPDAHLTEALEAFQVLQRPKSWSSRPRFSQRIWAALLPWSGLRLLGGSSSPVKPCQLRSC